MFLFLRRSHPEEFCKKTTSFFLRLLFSLTHFNHWSFSIPPEIIRNPLIFRCFQGVKNETSDMTEAVAKICSVKKVFLEISQNSQENTCARVSFLIKLQASPLVAASYNYYFSLPSEYSRNSTVFQANF